MSATTPTNVTAAASGTILALDLGKFKRVASLDDRATDTAVDGQAPAGRARAWRLWHVCPR
jgi:hypothetical protein